MNDYPSRVTLFDDGVYRWSYDMDMWRNLFMLRHVLKILGLMCVLVFFTMLAAFGPRDLKPLYIAVLFLTPAALFALTLLIYLICALWMKGNYHILFEMDEGLVMLVQSAASAQRTRSLMALGRFAALGRRSGALHAALGAADSVGITRFSDITSLRLYPDDDVIALREWFGMNQIYVPREDYPFVRDYILSRVPEKARRRCAL